MHPFETGDEPSQGGFLDRGWDTIRRDPYLRVLLVVTLVDDAAALALVATGDLSPYLAAYLVLLSTLTWLFGFALPLFNHQMQLPTATRVSYLAQLVVMFGRVVLGVATALFTVALLHTVF